MDPKNDIIMNTKEKNDHFGWNYYIVNRTFISASVYGADLDLHPPKNKQMHIKNKPKYYSITSTHNYNPEIQNCYKRDKFGRKPKMSHIAN